MLNDSNAISMDTGYMHSCFSPVTVTKWITSIGVISMICLNNWDSITSELNDLRKFHDPETVELMNWIIQNSHLNDTFAGSMQLMAGIKCCTGRRLTNHPHFEDKILRDATKEIYQIYAFQTPKVVYQLLQKYNANFFVIESDICYAPTKFNYCSLKEIIDIENGHLIPSESNLSVNSKSSLKRFCHGIKINLKEYKKYFRLAWQNYKFRVYELNK